MRAPVPAAAASSSENLTTRPCAPSAVAERLAANGVKLNRFHTTALCSPTRQAMLTGRNHHSVGMGAITENGTVGNAAVAAVRAGADGLLVCRHLESVTEVVRSLRAAANPQSTSRYSTRSLRYEGA